MRLALSLALLLAASPAVACVFPPPPLKLNGENDATYAERSKAFFRAQLDEEQRDRQVQLYDGASRVSLARVTSSTPLPGTLNDEYTQGRRIEVQPLAAFKGAAPDGQTFALQDAGITSCGIYGGGSATRAEPGAYILLFENAWRQGPSGHIGLLLTEVREPRVLKKFTDVVQKAGAAAARQ